MLGIVNIWRLRRRLLRMNPTLEVHGRGYLEDIHRITFGSYCFLNHGYHLIGRGGIHFGSNVICGEGLRILTFNHNYEGSELPYGKEIVLKSVKIQDNVWIGSWVTILPGVTIGEGAIVAAGSIVTKNVDPCAIVGGNPAKLIKERDKEQYQSLKLKEKYYQKRVFYERYVSKNCKR
jgi:maltose O-acetyltransferase